MSHILIPLFTALLLSACGLNSESGVSSNDGEAKTTADQNTKTPSIGLSSEPSIGKSVLLASLKDGGYVIYFRHATTVKDLSLIHI